MSSTGRFFMLAFLCVVTICRPSSGKQSSSEAIPASISDEDWGIVQEAYLKASNTDFDDDFGSSVAISGDTVVIGAGWESSSATGVNGDQNDNQSMGAGAVYVFIRDEAGWRQQAYLKAYNTEAEDAFGYSVAIDGDTIVVGAILEDSDATGVNNDRPGFGAPESGAAYVFVRDGATWSQQAYLKASNTEAHALFGSSVAIDGNTIIVGSYLEDSSDIGVNGSGGSVDFFAENSGAAYIFERNGTNWIQQAYLKSSYPTYDAFFGCSVSISDDTVVVGATRENSNATGVNGDQFNYDAASAGAAYVFVCAGSAWTQQAYLKASNTAPHDYFGESVAIFGDHVVVGARGEDSSAVGVNRDESNDDAESSGAGYVFVRNNTNWTQQAYLKAPNTGADDGFGSSVCISGTTIAIKSANEASNATGVNGDSSNNDAPFSGAVYIYVRVKTAWGQLAYLKASNAEMDDQLRLMAGLSGGVAISNGRIVVGAPGEGSISTGVNGDESDNSVVYAGAAYIFSDYTKDLNGITACGSGPGSFWFEWVPVDGLSATVHYAPDWIVPFTNLPQTISYPANSYTDTAVSNAACFYKIELGP